MPHRQGFSNWQQAPPPQINKERVAGLARPRQPGNTLLYSFLGRGGEEEKAVGKLWHIDRGGTRTGRRHVALGVEVATAPCRQARGPRLLPPSRRRRRAKDLWTSPAT